MLRIAIRDSSGERVFATERDEILVGSREGADVRLADAAVEPNHCILRAESGRVRLLSLSSKGAAVAGKRVGEAMLAPGEEFAVGAAVVKVLAMSGASRLAIDEPPSLVPPGPPPERPRPPKAPDGDFAREVRATLSKAPWYLVSLMLHMALLLLMSLIEIPQPRVEPIAHIAVAAPKEETEPELPPDTPVSFEEHDPGRLDEIPFEEPQAEPARAAPSDAETAEFPGTESPDRLGLGLRPVTRLPVALPYSKIKGGDQALNKADLDGEQGRATDEVKRGLGGGLHEARQRLSKEHIVVVRGAHDKIEAVLDGYEWQYTLVSRDELLMHGCPKARILFVNCNNRPPPAVAAKLGALVKRLLQGGCWVVTSDWSVEPYLTEAFPSIVRAMGAPRSQRDTKVIVAAAGNDHLLDGVFPRGGGSEWWLEDSSTMVTVSDKVTPLVESEDMRTRYGSRVVAFKFPYANGIVIHLVGHFYQKDGNVHGLVAMHRLINNVIVERVRADTGR